MAALGFVNRHALLRAYFRVRRLDIPAADLTSLRAHVNPGTAAFLGPNHPEFGCDWMIDKEISTIVAPHMASWADRGIVASAPGFWGRNNLIANDGGDAARAYSVECALRGEGVLLHPEGSVRWTSDFVHPLFPGIAQMAMAAAQRADRPVYIVPIVWKLHYLGDVSAALHREMEMLENGLGVPHGNPASVAERFATLQVNVLAKQMRTFAYEPPDYATFFERQVGFQQHIVNVLAERHNVGDTDVMDRRIARTARLVRQRLSETRDDVSESAVAVRAQLKADAALAEEAKRLGEFPEALYGRATFTQEHVGESLKRMRDRLLNHTAKQKLGNMLPRPFGVRVAHVGVPAPLLVGQGANEQGLLEAMRASMQARLDEINAGIEPAVARYRMPNLLI